MTKPTTASLKRELRDMTAQRDLFEESSQVHAQFYEEKTEHLDKVVAAASAYLASTAREWPTKERAALVAAVGEAGR